MAENDGALQAAAAAASSIAQLAGQAVQAIGGKNEQRRAFNYAKRLNSYNTALGDEYSRKLAEDSDMIALLSRKKAGLNPYSMDDFSQVSIGSIPNASGPGMVPIPEYGKLGATISQSLLSAAQIHNLNAETNKTKAETEWINPLNEAQLAQIDAAISLTDSQEKLNYSHIELNDQSRQDIKDRLTMAKEQFPQILQQLGLSNQELEKKIQEIDANIKISTEMLPANLKLAAAQAYAAYSQGGAAAATARYTLESISLIQPTLQSLQRENKIGDATMNLEVAGASINYKRLHKALKADELENAAKELQNQLKRSDMYWTEKSGTQKIDYVFDKVGQIVDIGKNIGLGAGGVLHGLNQFGQYKERKVDIRNKRDKVYTDQIKYGYR